MASSSCSLLGRGYFIAVCRRVTLKGCLLLLVVSGIIPSMAGCVANSGAQLPPRLTANVPTVTPLDETLDRQVKAGLEITIIPATYNVQAKDIVTYQKRPPTLTESLAYSDNQFVYVSKVTKSALVVTPDRLEFILHVNNQMARVFHGGGAAVQFKIGGLSLPVRESGYSNLENAIVPPRNGLDIEIYGPKLSDLPSKGGVMGVFLYDLVTGQNDAGTVTQKQNFEWYFHYTVTPHSVQGHVDIEEDLLFSPEQYSALMAQNRSSTSDEIPAQ